MILDGATISTIARRLAAISAPAANTSTLGSRPSAAAEASALGHIKWKYKSVPPRQACVLLPLCHVAGRASVLFTVRSSQLRNHAGEVSFPGGKRDPTDPSLAHAALRETEEEIGVTAVRLLGKLTPLPDKSLTTEVHPFVGVLFPHEWHAKHPEPHSFRQLLLRQSDSLKQQPPQYLIDEWDVPGDLDVRSLILNHSEVEYAFTMALEELLDPAARSYERFREMTHVLAPYWRGPMEERIWGLTAFILNESLAKVFAPASQDSE